MSLAEGGTEVLGYIRIGYTSETVKDYEDGLTKAETLEALRELVRTYRRVADDAWQIVKDMQAPAFTEFRKGLRSERRGKFAGEGWADKYMAILMPEILFRVAMVADQYKVPWGCAYIRLKDVGRISESGHVARWIEPEAPQT